MTALKSGRRSCCKQEAASRWRFASCLNVTCRRENYVNYCLYRGWTFDVETKLTELLQRVMALVFVAQTICLKVPCLLLLLTLLHVIIHRCLDRVFSQQAMCDTPIESLPAVKLYWRELQMIWNICVLDRHGFFQSLSLHPFAGDRAGSNGWTAAERFELGVDDLSIGDLNLSIDVCNDTSPGASSHHRKQELRRFPCQYRRHSRQKSLNNSYPNIRHIPTLRGCS